MQRLNSRHSGLFDRLSQLSGAGVLRLGLCCAVLFAPGCAPSSDSVSAQSSRFDSARAWKDLEKIVAIGTRQAGTPGAEACRVYLEAELSASHLKPIREDFKHTTPVGELAFTNLYVDLPPAIEGKDQSWILLCSHYDTKRLPGAFVGANDGGSGTAVLLELARALAAGPRGDFGYRILFLDGEEAVNHEWVDPDNRYGSRYHAAQLKASGRASRFKACVLLDMIGDKDLRFDQEAMSDAKLYAAFSNAARDLGLGEHITAKRGPEIIDDHRMFMEAGIRSMDLIDFSYGPDNSWWHTLDDKLENCSKASLDIIGRVVLKGLPELEQHLSGY